MRNLRPFLEAHTTDSLVGRAARLRALMNVMMTIMTTTPLTRGGLE